MHVAAARGENREISPMKQRKLKTRPADGETEQRSNPFFMKFCWRMGQGACICAQIDAEERPCLVCSSRLEIRLQSVGFR